MSTRNWTKEQWARAAVKVTRNNRCPHCGKPDWCVLYPSVGRNLCMRTPSDWPAGNGGWWHVVGAPTYRPEPRYPLPPLRPPPPRTKVDYDWLLKIWSEDTTPEDYERLAGLLGVPQATLRAMSAVYARPHGAWGIPMQDATGKTCGIRLRNERGQKWAVAGSRSGLFLPGVAPGGRRIFIVEGPTDTMAGLALGLYCIGRASCNTGYRDINEFIRAHKIQEAVIVSDNDSPKRLPNGRWVRPGPEGAKRLLGSLRCAGCLITPPCKDLRQWYVQGATLDAVQALIDNAVWRLG